eukprot:m.43421 g.43421  ORF g.43421 m.43421 type:complete len:720 (+) comp7109_c0_seq1:302-2461(+)
METAVHMKRKELSDLANKDKDLRQKKSNKPWNGHKKYLSASVLKKLNARETLPTDTKQEVEVEGVHLSRTYTNPNIMWRQCERKTALAFKRATSKPTSSSKAKESNKLDILNLFDLSPKKATEKEKTSSVNPKEKSKKKQAKRKDPPTTKNSTITTTITTQQKKSEKSEQAPSCSVHDKSRNKERENKRHERKFHKLLSELGIVEHDKDQQADKEKHEVQQYSSHHKVALGNDIFDKPHPEQCNHSSQSKSVSTNISNCSSSSSIVVHEHKTNEMVNERDAKLKDSVEETKQIKSNQNFHSNLNFEENILGSEVDIAFLVQEFEAKLEVDKESSSYEHLLRLCSQKEPISLEHGIGGDQCLQHLVKVGEGSYAEVYSLSKKYAQKLVLGAGKGATTTTPPSTDFVNGVAFKIMPIGGNVKINGDVPKPVEDVCAEVECTQNMSKLATGIHDASSGELQYLAPGYICEYGVHVCKGATPPLLLSKWDAYLEKKGDKCENDRPDVFEEDQLHLVFVFENGGEDLESFSFTSLYQAQYILLNVILTVAVAEMYCEFEHRDLHWGNVLVQRTDTPTTTYVFKGKRVEIPCGGYSCKIIDFTLSRMAPSTQQSVVYYDLEKDQDIFTSEGDIQFDVYREMRNHVGKEWKKFDPRTNVSWIRYLTLMLLNNKIYKSKAKREAGIRKNLEEFTTCLESCVSACDIIRKATFVHNLCPDQTDILMAL